MPITALPIAPNRQDPATFSSRADAWVGALDTFTTEANALQTDVNAKQVTASNAATTATNAVQAINSALNRYTFSTTTTMADPGVGVIRFNNATASSATAIAIDAQSADTGNPNVLNLLLSFGDSTNNPKGLIRFTQAGTPANYRAYNVTAVTDNTGWVQFTVTHVAGAGSFSNGASLVMEFHRAGNAGDVQLSADNTFTGNNSFNNATVISANSSSDALRITQTGAGNALVVEDSASPFVIDPDGRVINGHTMGIQLPDVQGVQRISGTQVLGTTYQNSGIGVCSFINGASAGASLTLAQSRNTTVGNHTVVANGDVVGAIQFAGSDGTSFIRGSRITGEADGNPATGSMPGRLVFSTTPSGGSTPVERMRIDSEGRVGIGTASLAGSAMRLGSEISGGTNAQSIWLNQTVQPDVTASATGFYSQLGTAAATFTLTNLEHFRAFQGTLGAGSTVTNQIGFNVSSNLIGATNNYGFYSNIPAGTGRWNFYADGSAANRFNGAVGLSKDPSDTYTLDINGFQRTVGSAASIPVAYIENTSTNTAAIALRVVGGVSISRTAVTTPVVSDGNVFSGTYTPTLTNVTNVAASTAFVCQYVRVGDVVTVSGLLNIDPTATGTFRVDMTIPVGTIAGTSSAVGGTFMEAGSGASWGAVTVGPGGGGTVVRFNGQSPASASNQGFAFTFTYRIA